MAKDSKIEWTQATWNPVRGCSPVSPGCKRCYAERTAGRFCKPGEPFDGFVHIGKNGEPGPHWTGKVELIPHMLDAPLRTRKPTTYFVNSMSDLFHEDLPDEAIDRVFAVMLLCPQHTFQVLTKRAGRMRCLLYERQEQVRSAIPDRIQRNFPLQWPLPNVHLGVSVEDQQRADERIPKLLQTPAAVRFLSVEPLLGPVDLEHIPCKDQPWITRNVLTGRFDNVPFDTPLGARIMVAVDTKPRIDWVIVGGESGPDARPCDIAWIRSIVAQCKAAGVACFVKQLGANPRDGAFKYACENDSRKGGDPMDWPHGLRVREMPALQSRELPRENASGAQGGQGTAKDTG